MAAHDPILADAVVGHRPASGSRWRLSTSIKLGSLDEGEAEDNDAVIAEDGFVADASAEVRRDSAEPNRRRSTSKRLGSLDMSEAKDDPIKVVDNPSKVIDFKWGGASLRHGLRRGPRADSTYSWGEAPVPGGGASVVSGACSTCS